MLIKLQGDGFLLIDILLNAALLEDSRIHEVHEVLLIHVSLRS